MGIMSKIRVSVKFSNGNIVWLMNPKRWKLLKKYAFIKHFGYEFDNKFIV